jgi:hypothetical protein
MFLTGGRICLRETLYVATSKTYFVSNIEERKTRPRARYDRRRRKTKQYVEPVVQAWESCETLDGVTCRISKLEEGGIRGGEGMETLQ